MKGRFYGLVFLLLLALEVCIARFVRDSFIRPYVGDVLVILLLYCLGRAVGLRTRWLAPGVTLVGVLAELLQYIHLPDLLGLSTQSPLRLALGSTFDPADLLCYLTGGALLFGWEAWLEFRLRHQKEDQR